jgi:hypothetical protein
MSRSAAIAVISCLLALLSLTAYQDTVIAQQRHTIRQLMGLELGPHATPRPKDELPLSSAPNPETRSI